MLRFGGAVDADRGVAVDDDRAGGTAVIAVITPGVDQNGGAATVAAPPAGRIHEDAIGIGGGEGGARRGIRTIHIDVVVDRQGAGDGGAGVDLCGRQEFRQLHTRVIDAVDREGGGIFAVGEDEIFLYQQRSHAIDRYDVLQILCRCGIDVVILDHQEGCVGLRIGAERTEARQLDPDRAGGYDGLARHAVADVHLGDAAAVSVTDPVGGQVGAVRGPSARTQGIDLRADLPRIAARQRDRDDRDKDEWPGKLADRACSLCALGAALADEASLVGRGGASGCSRVRAVHVASSSGKSGWWMGSSTRH